MTGKCVKEIESLFLKGKKKFEIGYFYAEEDPTKARRNLFSGKISSISEDVQAELGFPDFDLYLSMLHAIRSFARKSPISHNVFVRVDGRTVQFTDHGSSVTVS